MFGGQVDEEGLNFGSAHFEGMAFVVEEDVTAYPVYVSLFGAVRVMPGAEDVARLVEEFFGHMGT